jgi:hypothetical protein
VLIAAKVIGEARKIYDPMPDIDIYLNDEIDA